MASQKEREQLKGRKDTRDRIAAVLRMPGWKDINEIFEEELDGAAKRLLEKDDPEARAILNTLKRVSEKISDEIDWGNVAADKLKKVSKPKAE